MLREAPSLIDLISGQIADPEAQWSLGTFGAIAEFSRDAGEPAALATSETSASAVTPRGGIRIDAREGLRPFAFETVTTQAWSQRIVFCLPEQLAAMSRRKVLTEIGPDAQALLEEDRGAIVFDLGLDALQVDACIRTADEELIAALRECVGRPVFDAANPAMGLILRHSPNRVFATRCGRVEVYQPIPRPGGKSPMGPHTHVLPKLLAAKRTHAATEPIPRGFVSCAHLYPAHPLRDADGKPRPFDHSRHGAFQRLMSRYGDIDNVRLKRNVVKAVVSGAAPNAIATPTDRYAQAAVRVALRQLKAADGPSPALTEWFLAHDRGPVSDEGESGHA